ncbi:PAS domain-containing sensor histidine kinase [Cytophagaceae bacterium YF14B1]|uniref:histidine kinase n=1 Tax=Xanthocytophaga flava TaxID=3048013 RepID=A0AAE3QL49_9BACT|nr:PAS domain-containing sensor histidine kinase [Xanthocytophaga flavus]MDJ1480930.1 PAS domain-containing sensor histidine kinase [Xanthocytophaga flavus]
MESHDSLVSNTLYQLAEQNDLIVFIFEPDTKQFLYLSPAFEQIFDRSREGLLYTDLFSLLDADDQSYLEEAYQKLLSGEDNPTGEANKNLEFRIALPDETIKWLQVKPLLITVQQHTRLITGTAEDITARRHYIELESRHANKKNAILQILSHDLAGPLATIQSLSSVISTAIQSYKNEDISRLIDLITQTSKRSIKIIRDFIEQEFLESAESDLVKTRVNLVEIVGQMLEEMQRSEQYLQKTFHFTHSDPTIYAVIDEVKFVQIINNLLSNAIKFTSDDGVITVSIDDNEQTDTIRLTVKDNGIGIPEKYHASLFDKFTKARRPGLRKEVTVGLGMSIIKTIVEWHQGKIWFESKENAGSTFFVEIPRYGVSHK